MPFGTFIRTDDITASKSKLDVARLLIRTKCFSLINESLSMNIGDLVVKFMVVKDTQGSLRMCSFNKQPGDYSSDSSS